MKKILFMVILLVSTIFLVAGCEDVLMGKMIYEEYDNGLSIEYVNKSKYLHKITFGEVFFKNDHTISIHTVFGVINISNQLSTEKYLIKKGFKKLTNTNNAFVYEDSDVEIIVHRYTSKLDFVSIVERRKMPQESLVNINIGGNTIKCPNSPDAIHNMFGVPIVISSYNFL